MWLYLENNPGWGLLYLIVLCFFSTLTITGFKPFSGKIELNVKRKD
jgi:hypothetical protein